MAAGYPTQQHKEAAESITAFFTATGKVDAVLLVNSCARGKAVPDSCLDINVLVQPEIYAEEGKALESAWEHFYATDDVFKALARAGKYSEVHLDVVNGQFTPGGEEDWVGPPDSFELEVGNALAYSVPLWEGSDYYRRLKKEWLPYYTEDLRHTRLTYAHRLCFNNLDHIPLYIQRGLYFQSFDRLYNAYRLFLQALFISHRTYPIAYDKWIHEQIVEILGLPELYRQLPGLFEIKHFESAELVEKGERLRKLYAEYVND